MQTFRSSLQSDVGLPLGVAALVCLPLGLWLQPLAWLLSSLFCVVGAVFFLRGATFRREVRIDHTGITLSAGVPPLRVSDHLLARDVVAVELAMDARGKRFVCLQCRHARESAPLYVSEPERCYRAVLAFASEPR